MSRRKTMRRSEPRDFYIDRFGRVWAEMASSLCGRCGQPVSLIGICNHRKMSRDRVRFCGGRESCLVNQVWSFPMVVSAAHWASLEPIGMKPWQAPAPKIASVRDVRKLHSCGYCGRMGTDLVAIGGQHGDHVHAYCLVKECGTGILHVMSLEQLGKATLSEIVALGLKDSFMDLYDAAKRREARRG